MITYVYRNVMRHVLCVLYKNSVELYCETYVIVILRNHQCQESDRMMATAPLQPPTPFCFKKLDESPRWKRRFEQYHMASGLSAKDEEIQPSTLLYCLGTDADDILMTIRISDEDRKKYAKVLEKLDKFLK